MVTMVRFEQKLPITFYSPLWFQACMKIRLEKSHSILLLSAEWCISSSSVFFTLSNLFFLPYLLHFLLQDVSQHTLKFKLDKVVSSKMYSGETAFLFA